jgi:uncharacterized LabA/DUF88 family protein
VAADELRRQADVFIDLTELKPKISREDRSQEPRVNRKHPSLDRIRDGN